MGHQQIKSLSSRWPRTADSQKEEFLPKIDQAGAHAGIWLESLEADFDALEKKPEGTLKKFSKSDFDGLFQALFGYKRK